MGQEASVPVNEADALEEQAKAPPSASVVDNGRTGGVAHHATAAGPGRSSSRKIMGAMFRHTGGGGTDKGGGGTTVQHNLDYEHREAARAAVAGGHLYDGTGDDFAGANGNRSYQYDQHQQQHQQQHRAAQHNQEITSTLSSAAAVGSNSTPQQTYGDLPAVPFASVQQSHSQQQPVVGVLYEKQPSSKRGGLFSVKSTRGVINSMRNLTITGALRKHKEVADWEKQWDEDDDESEGSDDDGDVNSQIPAAPQHVHYGGVQGGGVQPTPPVSPKKGPATVSPHYLSPSQRPGMEAGATNRMNAAGDTSFETQQLSGLSASDKPVSPPRIQLQHTNLAVVSPGGDILLQQQQQGATDLLSEPMPTPADNLQQYSAESNNSVEWDNTVPCPPPLEEEDGSKPNVDMFMPMLRVLGKGSFGKVVLVQKRVGKERGQLFAMKILKKTHLVKRRQIERTRTERKVLSVVNHPFIMKLHYAFQTEDKLYLVLDYCPGGELFFHLSRFRRFPERVARFYAAELLLAIGHLHKRGIIYRDLKPENVLLDAEGHLKLGDFGLAKSGITHPLTGATSMCGTPEYMAPEVLAQDGHGFCVDYWGLGMIVYEMMTGLPPWYTTDRAQLFRRLKSAPLEIPSYFSVASANCVSALLDRNPRRRLGVSGIRSAMEHEFFRNISWRSLYSRRVEAPVRPCEGWRPPEPIRDGDEALQPTYNYANPASSLDFERLDSAELDNATQNFDNQFTRMPVESEDHVFDPAAEGINCEELNEETFLGFSFDIVKHREEEAAAIAALNGSNSSFGPVGNLSIPSSPSSFPS